jgi:hypothetical protein
MTPPTTPHPPFSGSGRSGYMRSDARGVSEMGLSEILCNWFGVMLRLSGWGVEMITDDEGTSEALSC